MLMGVWNKLIEICGNIIKYITSRVDWPIIIALIAAVIFAVVVRLIVSITLGRHTGSKCESGKTGAEVAREILDRHGLEKVRIKWTFGRYNDRYIPRRKLIKLSRRVYFGRSVTAVAVAAHECGHAIQHSERYFPLKFRSVLVPIVNIFSKFSTFAIFIGCLIAIFTFVGKYVILAGLILFGFSTLFHLVTLPCEVNASKRAMVELRTFERYTDAELNGATRVLRAAAMTYISALALSVIQLVRLVRIFGRY